MNQLLFDPNTMESAKNDPARQKILEQIAERLNALRKEKGITQVEMAKKLKTTQSIYSRYERADVRLYVDTLLRISQILGVTPNELFGVTKSRGDDPIEHSIPKRFIRQLRGVENLTRTQQDSLLLIIDATVTAGNKKRTKNASTSKAS